MALSPHSLMEAFFCLPFINFHTSGQTSPNREVLCARATRQPENSPPLKSAKQLIEPSLPDAKVRNISCVDRVATLTIVGRCFNGVLEVFVHRMTSADEIGIGGGTSLERGHATFASALRECQSLRSVGQSFCPSLTSSAGVASTASLERRVAHLETRSSAPGSSDLPNPARPKPGLNSETPSTRTRRSSASPRLNPSDATLLPRLCDRSSTPRRSRPSPAALQG